MSIEIYLLNFNKIKKKFKVKDKMRQQLQTFASNANFNFL